MDKGIKGFVGLDVHKESIAMALAEAQGGAGKFLGTIAHDLSRLLKRLRALGQPGELKIVYEAGPTGYGLQRALHAEGYLCEVIAPSLTPRCPGQRVKTDRRDAVHLAELASAGRLKAIYIPSAEDEAMRDLSRAREDAVKARTQARQQLKGFLLRHDLRYPAKSSWGKSFHRWLATVTFEKSAMQSAFTEYQLALQAADERVARLTKALEDCVVTWRFEPVVSALRALRGIDTVSAVGLVAEIGDIARFAHPRELMGYLGLVPSESSSGERIRRGSITKTGNQHARRLLIEAAWNYRYKPRIGYAALRRQEKLPEPIRALAWKAQLRLTTRFARLQGRGVHKNKVCVAVARELAGFVWAIANALAPLRA